MQIVAEFWMFGIFASAYATALWACWRSWEGNTLFKRILFSALSILGATALPYYIFYGPRI